MFVISTAVPMTRTTPIISGTDRELAHSRPGEDLLGDDGARHELGEQQPDDGDDRDE